MDETITLRLMGPDDLDDLLAIEEGLFDLPMKPAQVAAFLNDANHMLVLAFAGAQAVGMASGQIMFHPDKDPALFIAEVGVRESHQRRGIGMAVCQHLMDAARSRGCQGIWVAAEGDNEAARALYQSLGALETGGVVVYDWDGAMDG